MNNQKSSSQLPLRWSAGAVTTAIFFSIASIYFGGIFYTYLGYVILFCMVSTGLVILFNLKNMLKNLGSRLVFQPASLMKASGVFFIGLIIVTVCGINDLTVMLVLTFSVIGSASFAYESKFKEA